MAISKSNPFTIQVVNPTPTSKTWLYFKGNGQDAGRNDQWDRINLQRYLYIPKDADLAPWTNGMTITWQIVPVRQAAYYTTFFFAASSGTDFYDLTSLGYVGAHPYPISAHSEPGGEDFTRHKWEISVDSNDYTSDLVDYGNLFTQALTYEPSHRATFFTQIVAPSDVTSFAQQTGQKSGYHQNSALVFGNCPWWNAHQHERLSGFIRRIKVFNKALSDADTVQEALSDSLVSGNDAALWWSKIDFQTPDDLTSDFGVSRSAAWIDAHKADVVADNQLSSHPAMAAPATVQAVHQERG